LNILLEIGAYSVLLFFAVMVCHGELYRLRPDPKYLTYFYLMVSIGGALGGLFVNFAAPMLFNGYWEFQIGIFACFSVLAIIFVQEKLLVFKGPGWIRTPLMLGGLVVMGLFHSTYIKAINTTTMESSRNFFGVLRIKEDMEDTSGETIIIMSHGATNHGFQYVDNRLRNFPTAYYGNNTGSGIAFSHYRDLLLEEDPEANLQSWSDRARHRYPGGLRSTWRLSAVL
jgi:hypothetical protein